MRNEVASLTTSYTNFVCSMIQTVLSWRASFTHSWIYHFSLIHLFDWSSLIDSSQSLGDTFKVPNLETGAMEPLITGDDDGALTALEEEQFRNMVNRLHAIFKYAKKQNVRVMVDAEQSYFQPAIHR